MTKKKRMVLPTEQEVALHMAKHCGLKPEAAVREAQRFMGYWESCGWRRKGGPMVSWRGSVASWIGYVDADKFTGKGILDNAAKADFLRKEMANEG